MHGSKNSLKHQIECEEPHQGWKSKRCNFKVKVTHRWTLGPKTVVLRDATHRRCIVRTTTTTKAQGGGTSRRHRGGEAWISIAAATPPSWPSICLTPILPASSAGMQVGCVVPVPPSPVKFSYANILVFWIQSWGPRLGYRSVRRPAASTFEASLFTGHSLPLITKPDVVSIQLINVRFMFRIVIYRFLRGLRFRGRLVVQHGRVSVSVGKGGESLGVF